LVYFFCIVGFVSLLIGLNLVLNQLNLTDDKVSVYECGFKQFGEVYVPHEINYYNIALVFLLFDVELIFLIPLSVILFNGFYYEIDKICGYIFLMILCIGLIWEYLFDIFEVKRK